MPHVLDGPFSLFGQDIKPLTVYHGKTAVTGFRIGGFAYVTDCNMIPDQAMAALQNLEVLVLGALRYKPHHTHFSIGEAIRVIETYSLNMLISHIYVTKWIMQSLSPHYRPAFSLLMMVWLWIFEFGGLKPIRVRLRRLVGEREILGETK